MATFKFEGLDKILEQLSKMPEAVTVAVLKEGANVLEPMAEAVRREAPVDSGAMRDHVELVKAKRKKDWVFSLVRVGSKKGSKVEWYKDGEFYPAYIAYGFERRGVLYPPNNYVRRGFDATSDEIQSRAAEVIKAAVEKAWKP